MRVHMQLEVLWSCNRNSKHGPTTIILCSDLIEGVNVLRRRTHVTLPYTHWETGDYRSYGVLHLGGKSSVKFSEYIVHHAKYGLFRDAPPPCNALWRWPVRYPKSTFVLRKTQSVINTSMF